MTNPGTSEMHFVAALDRVPGMRAVLGLQENVAFCGSPAYGDYSTVVRYYQTCDVFVMPNRTLANGDTEGFGLVFLRATACGKPVVLQDTGFGSHLPCGEGLFAPATIDEASESLAEIAGNYNRHAEAARELAHEYLEAEKVLTRFLDEVLT